MTNVNDAFEKLAAGLNIPEEYIHSVIAEKAIQRILELELQIERPFTKLLREASIRQQAFGNGYTAGRESVKTLQTQILELETEVNLHRDSTPTNTKLLHTKIRTLQIRIIELEDEVDTHKQHTTTKIETLTKAINLHKSLCTGFTPLADQTLYETLENMQ